MPQADVAVVVPVFNRARAVLETLSTVARQTTLPRRLIVVDDGSCDGTAKAVRQWIAQTRPGFETQVIEQSNIGAGGARNRGLHAAEDCRYVAFLDSDDHWPEDFLERTVARLESNTAAVAATSDREYHRRWKRRLGFRSSRGLEHNAPAWLLTPSSGITSCTLFRTSVAHRLGGYDASIPTGQDVEFFLRVSLAGPWLHAPGAPVRFYVGFTTARGEAGNLSMKYADRQHRWVRIRERFLFKQNGQAHLSRHVYQRLLAKLWHKTGCAYKSQGRHARAAACFRKALKYQPSKFLSWFRLAIMETDRITLDAFASRGDIEPRRSSLLTDNSYSPRTSAAA